MLTDKDLSRRTKRIKSPKPMFTTDLIFGLYPKTLEKLIFPIGFVQQTIGGVSAYKNMPLILLSVVS